MVRWPAGCSPRASSQSSRAWSPTRRPSTCGEPVHPAVSVHEVERGPYARVRDRRVDRLRLAGYVATAMIDFGNPPIRSTAIRACGK